MERIPIDVDELKKVFRIRNGNLERINYHYPNGKWTIVENNPQKGNHGYCKVQYNRYMLYYHYIVWVLSTNKNIPYGLEIDHINGNRIDNRIENLRLVSHRKNQQNKQMHRDGRLAGISLCKETKKYIVILWVNIKYIYIGRFKTEQEAHRAYTIACEHIADYKDNKSFRKLIKKEMEDK